MLVSPRAHRRFGLASLLALLAFCSQAIAQSKPLRTLVEPFTPPTLAELDAKAQWEPMPVLDALKVLRERQAKVKVLCSVKEALALKNNNTANNEKILSALGRLPAREGAVNWDAVCNRHESVDARSTNPVMASSTVEFSIQNLLAAGLFNFDAALTPYAMSEYVKSWHSSKDKMYDKVVMRDDLTWSDGKPLTAYDVEFTFFTIMNPDVPIPAVRSQVEEIRYVKAYDAHTLVYFHKLPLATNIWNVNYLILPKHVYEKSLAEDTTLMTSDYHVKLEAEPVTGGPYVLAKRVRGQELLLTRRESWYMHGGKQVRDKPYFKDVRFRLIQDPNTALLSLKKGDIDVLELNASQWLSQTVGDDFYAKNTKATGTEWLYYYIGWNIDAKRTPFFTDKRVRQAMSYALNHDEMLKSINFGLFEPCNGVFHRDSWMAPKIPPKPYKQDLDKAEDLLDAAGWTDHDGDGVRDKKIDGKNVKFEFTIICAPQPDRVALCRQLKTDLDQIGVVCNVRPTEFTVLQQMNQDHNFDATMAAWRTGSDPDTLENIFGTKKGRNFGQYANPKIDQLFEQGRKEFDRSKRAAIYGQIHNIIYEDQPYTFLYFRNSFYGFNKDLRGYVYSPRGPFNYAPGFNSFWKGAE